MTVIVRSKTPLVVPMSVRRKAGFRSGQELEFRAAGGVITIAPKLPPADDEYTTVERRRIDARLADARKGPYYGPFETAHEAIAFLRKESTKRKAAKRKTT